MALGLGLAAGRTAQVGEVDERGDVAGVEAQRGVQLGLGFPHTALVGVEVAQVDMRLGAFGHGRSSAIASRVARSSSATLPRPSMLGGVSASDNGRPGPNEPDRVGQQRGPEAPPVGGGRLLQEPRRGRADGSKVVHDTGSQRVDRRGGQECCRGHLSAVARAIGGNWSLRTAARRGLAPPPHGSWRRAAASAET